MNSKSFGRADQTPKWKIHKTQTPKLLKVERKACTHRSGGACCSPPAQRAGGEGSALTACQRNVTVPRRVSEVLH